MTALDARPLVAQLGRHVELARQTPDEDAIHDLRVACRRLKVWLWLGNRGALRADLSWLSRALGPLRDLHLVEQVAELRPWYEAQLGREHARATEVLSSGRVRGLLLGLAALPSVPEKLALRRLPRLRRRVLEAMRALRVAEPGERFEAAHHLRREVRKLRFGNEWLGLDAAPAKAVQDALGGVCDLVALSHLLERWAVETGRQHNAQAALRSLAVQVQQALTPAHE